MKLKNLLMVVAAFALGSWLFYSGLTDYKNNQRLQAEGKMKQWQGQAQQGFGDIERDLDDDNP